MNKSSKNALLGITYYSLIILMIAYIVFFIIGLRSDRVPNWATICYIILSVLLALEVVYDMICNNRGDCKFGSGIVLIILTFITVIMSFILFGDMSVRGAIPLTLTDTFYMQIALSYAINILTIIIYCVGAKLARYRLGEE